MSEQPLVSTSSFKALVALATAMLTVALGVGFIVPLLALYAESLGGGTLWMGLIFGANPAVRALCMPIVGSLADSGGKKRYLIIGLSGYCVVAALMGLAGQPWHLFVLRIMQGTFSAMVMPISRAYAGQLSPQGKEGSVMGMFNLSFMAGFSLGPLIGGILCDSFGVRIPFFIMGALSIVALLVTCMYVPDQASVKLTSGPRPSFITVMKSPIVKGLGCARAANALGRGMLSSLLPVYAVSIHGFTSTAVGTIIFAYSLLASSLQPIAGVLADRLNRKHMAICGFLLAPISLFLIPFSSSYITILLLCLIMGLGSGMFIPSSMAIAVSEGRKHGMASTMGFIDMAMSIGVTGGAILGGAFAELTSLPTAFSIMASISVLGLIPFLIYLRNYTIEDQTA